MKRLTQLKERSLRVGQRLGRQLCSQKALVQPLSNSGTFASWFQSLSFLTCEMAQLASLKEIDPEYSLEGLMLKLKLQYSGHLMQRTDSLGKTLTLGKTEGRKMG